ncbi:hypothetical protein AB0M54_47795, partial [Actinoplanes sp. NPDC051470]|uniref:hypothetical protein n=1 Tax=Actinoplanes sp. NPDC051470 TaxID=3157224 RepID=UPI00343B4B2D
AQNRLGHPATITQQPQLARWEFIGEGIRICRDPSATNRYGPHRRLAHARAARASTTQRSDGAVRAYHAPEWWEAVPDWPVESSRVSTVRDQSGDGGRVLGEEALRRLRRRSVCAIKPGLTDAEFGLIEQEFGFQFADDHKAFLAAGLPVNTRAEPRIPGVRYAHSEPWPDWRHADRDKLRGLLDRPSEGVLFDVEHKNFWYASWGPRPTDLASAMAAAKHMLAQVPTMVPVYGHRYLPAGRGTFGHPVLSLWQTDVIYYGFDLADYIDQEFSLSGSREQVGEPRASVGFWRDLV